MEKARDASLARALGVTLALVFGGAGVAAAKGPRCDVGVRLATARARAASSRASVGSASSRVLVSVWAAGGAAALRDEGWPARAAAGEVAYLEVNPDELDALLALPSLRAVEKARLLHARLDRSAAAVFAPQTRAALGVDGAGVVVGVVDTGLDFRHLDFRAADGSTRLLALLDVSQAADGRYPSLPAYGGDVWLRADVQAQLDADASGQAPAVAVTEVDLAGHGTHVAGIAAGNGRATGHGFAAQRYVGMAPGASLVAVKATRSGEGFLEEDVINGLRFVFDRANDAGLPAVINLSVGGDGGPHDGTTNFERAVDATLAPGQAGQAIVVAAGNGGSQDLHAGGWVASGMVTLSLPFPTGATPDQSIAVELWSDVAPASIRVIDPTGASHGPVAAGASDPGDFLGAVGQVAIDDASSGADAENGRFQSGIEVTGQASTSATAPAIVVAGGTWQLVLDFGSTATTGPDGPREIRWDAWLTGVSDAAIAPRFVDHLDEDERADVPAFATGVIAVGSFSTRNAWTTVDGTSVVRDDLVVGSDSIFSGSGPSADGRFVPDLSAPGDFVVSSLSSGTSPQSTASSFYVPGAPTYLVADDGVHGVLRGTSQAAPHVAGAAALLFALDPTLTSDRLREVLRASAMVERDAPGYSHRAGFGRLDVLAAAHAVLHLPTGAVDAATSSVGTSRDFVPPDGPAVRVSVVPRDAAGATLGAGHVVSIASDAGAFDGAEQDLGGGRYERSLLPRAKAGSVAHVTVVVDGVELAAHPAVWFTPDHAAVGVTAAKGCALGSRGAATSTVPLFAMAALGLWTRRARRRRERSTHASETRCARS